VNVLDPVGGQIAWSMFTVHALSIGYIAPQWRDWQLGESIRELLPPQVYASRRKMKRVIALWCRASVWMPQWRMRLSYRWFLRRENPWNGVKNGETDLRLMRKSNRYSRNKFRRMMRGERAPGPEGDDPTDAS